MRWAGNLHGMFARAGYHLVLSLYGHQHNGYMGVGLAVPLDRFEVMQVQLDRLSDTKPWPKQPSVDIWTRWMTRIRLWILSLLQWKQPNECPWHIARQRYNVMVSTKLRCKVTSQAFNVSTYHMPCIFKTPEVMVIHTALAAQRAYFLAAGDPFVLAGDFNFKPKDTCYNLMTTGQITEDDPAYPPKVDGETWTPKVPCPLQSAYCQALGAEPDFTNYSQFKDEPVFIDTLDYIFLSPEWTVNDVDRLPSRPRTSGPLPNASEPSDHLKIAAVVAFNKRQ